MRIVAFNIDETDKGLWVSDSTGEAIVSRNPIDILAFLNETYDATTLKIVYDLDAFIAPLLRLMGKDVCQYLATGKRQAFLKPFHLFYIPRKMFGMRAPMTLFGKTRPVSSNIYDIAQYYSEDAPHDNLGQIRDLGNKLLDNLKSIGIYARTLSSPAAIYEHCVLDNVMIPTMYDAPKKHHEAYEYAYRCCSQPWREAYQVGYWDKAYDVDLSSAYPYEASQLLSTKACSFGKSNTIPDGADWGYMDGIVTNEAEVSPFMYRDDKGNITSRIGSWPDTITLDDYKFMLKYKTGKFEIKDGWFLKFKAEEKPLEKLITQLYSYRSRSPELDKLAKNMANAGCFGKFLEKYADGTYGDYFNPIYGAQIMTRTKLRVAEFIYEHHLENHLIVVNTDGMLLDKNPGITHIKAFGQWRLSDVSPAIVVSSGQVYQSDKKPNNISYDELQALIKAKPNASHYATRYRRRWTLPEVIDGSATFEQLGKWDWHNTSIDLLIPDHEREFKTLPRTGKELLHNVYKGEPFTASL